MSLPRVELRGLPATVAPAKASPAKASFANAWRASAKSRSRTSALRARSARSLLGLVLGSALVAGGCRSTEPEEAPASPLLALAEGEHGIAIRCARVITADDQDRIFAPGMVAIRAGAIEYVGPPVVVPEGYELHELAEAWAVPGMVDLHSHIHTGGWIDINDGMLPVTPEHSSAPTIVAANPLVQRACSGGVTTMFGIPGSATSMGGFGVLYKAKTRGGFEDAVLANPGGLKVAQTHNPDRNGNAVLRSWAGLSWLLEDVNDKAVAALEQGRFDPALQNLVKVHAKELPVLIHTAGGEGVANTARMWRVQYDTQSVLSHGCFDGWKAAEWIAELGMPVNQGPRLMDYYSTRSGRIEPIAYVYWKAGVPNFSLNTDSQVVPQEQLFLQGAMAARQGVDGYQALRALTIHPAKAFGIDDRVGSLELQKDGDVVLWTGDPLDPRSRVELVVIDGEVQYDRKENGQWS